MPTPFASITRVALEEIVREHTTDSKFGHFLSEDGMADLLDALANFMETSRSLKSAGDRFLQRGAGAGSPPPRRTPRDKNP